MTRSSRITVSIVAFLLLAAAWWPATHDPALEYSEAGLKRALVMYAVARGMNAIISVAQESQITAQLGVGAVIAVGQVLDPINDLIEQFSTAMLLAAGAFGLQVLLLKIGAYWLLPFVLTLATLAFIGLIWRRGHAPQWLVRTVLVLLVARFAVPVSALASEMVYQGVLAGDYAESVAVISGSETARLAAAGQQQTAKVPESSGWTWPKWDDVKNAKEQFTAIVADMKRHAEATAEHMVRIAVVFLLQTLVLPLLFLWLVIAGARGLIVGATKLDMLSNERGA